MTNTKDSPLYDLLAKNVKIQVGKDKLTLTIDLPPQNAGPDANVVGDVAEELVSDLRLEEVFSDAGTGDRELSDNPDFGFSDDEGYGTRQDEEEWFEFDAEDLPVELDEDLTSDINASEPVRVKITLKAYVKMALHTLKYANPNIPQNDWVEIIGLMTGVVENADTPLACIKITDAHPIGHGNAVNAQIHDPQSFVKVYNEKAPGTSILGWYHSHPSYGSFMSDTDYGTQVRFQKLASGPNVTQPVALVMDHTTISTSWYGFKIFRLAEGFKKWDELKFEVLNLPLETLPQMLETLLPLTTDKAVFLEYE